MQATLRPARWILASSALLLAALPLAAHHSFSAEYDSSAKITLTGVVSRVEWSNPHVHFFVDVKDAGGSVTTWDLEGSPPNPLVRSGFTRNLIAVGDTVTFTGFRAKDASARVSRCQVLTADGREYNIGGASEFQRYSAVVH